MNAVLRASGLEVSYGGVKALSHVDLEVGEGRLVGLIGPNGAGKTTLIDAITGFTPARGRIELDGADISRLPPHRRARLGLARTWQSTELFDDLSVRENLAVTANRPPLGRAFAQLLTGRTVTHPGVERALELLGLSALAASGTESLSQGQRKLVGVARAIAGSPRIILLDEPAAGLDSAESELLGTHLRQLVAAGIPLLLVDHDMGLVLSVCHHVVVLDFGRVIAAGTPEQIRRDPRVVEAYLGRAAAPLAAGRGA